MNKILNDDERKRLDIVIQDMLIKCPNMMSRKIPRSFVQQAFVANTVMHNLKMNDKILCVGSFEDTAFEYLKSVTKNMIGIDPLINMDLRQFTESTKDKFDIIFSTSVIEHVPDDEQFILDICHLLNKNGLAVLTCDFKKGWKQGDPVHPLDCRFYTEYDLGVRLYNIITAKGCTLVGEPDWSGDPDFFFDGFAYNFATFVFRKTS